MNENYEVYAPTTAAEQNPAPTATWQVVVEYSNNGQAKPPTVVQVGRRTFPSRELALESAQQTAFDYDPPDPFSLQSRSVYRDGPDGFLVILQGAMTTFHMRVRIVQHVGDA